MGGAANTPVLQAISGGGTNYIQYCNCFDDRQKQVLEQMVSQIRTDLNQMISNGMQQTLQTSVTNAGNTKFSLFAQAVLKSVTAVVQTAGTSTGTAGHNTTGYSIVYGTNTAGILITGSDTAGTVLGPFTLTGTVPAGTLIGIYHGTETTGIYNATIAYSIPSALLT